MRSFWAIAVVPVIPPPPNQPNSFWLPCAVSTRPTTTLNIRIPRSMTSLLTGGFPGF